MSHSQSLLRNIRNNSRSYPTAAKSQVVPQGYEAVHQALVNYNGMFDLLLNMRSAFIRYGKLTDKQWAAAAKCLAPKPQDQTQDLSVKCNIPITISANAARIVARANNWPFNPRTLTVTEIKSADRKGFKLVVKIDWTGDSQDCRCCGKALTDWRSQATGVGPVCVKRTNIKYVTNQTDVARFQQEMEALAQKLGEVEVTIKRWHIQQGISAIQLAAKPTTPAVTSRTKVNITNCTWNANTNLFVVNGLAVPTDKTEVEVVNQATGNSRIFTYDRGSWKCGQLSLVFA